MKLLETKLSLIEWLLKLNDKTIINKIELIHQYSVDRWDELTDAQKTEIDEAIAELEKGQGMPHEKVMAKVRQR